MNGKVNDARAILVIDGETLALAHQGGEVSTIDVKAAGRAMDRAGAVLVRAFVPPRRQRMGAQSILVDALQSLPFYAVADALDDERTRLVEGWRTPFDRLLRAGPGDAGNSEWELCVPSDGLTSLTEAVFQDLARQDEATRDGPGAGEKSRIEAKLRFLDIKQALSHRIASAVQRRGAPGQPLVVAHYRCGAGALRLAMPAGTRYVGIDRVTPDIAQQALGTDTFVSLEKAKENGFGTPDVFLLTDMGDDPAAEAGAIAALAKKAPRLTRFIVLLQFGGRGTAGGVVGHSGLTATGKIIEQALQAPCEMRHLACISHKPRDLFAQTILVSFEVTR